MVLENSLYHMLSCMCKLFQNHSDSLYADMVSYSWEIVVKGFCHVLHFLLITETSAFCVVV
jgi:hypothetical protein